MKSLAEKTIAYLKMRNAVLAEKPELADEARLLAISLDTLRGFSADEIWTRLWPLPFYSAQRVGVATSRINGVKESGCWKTWALLVGSVEDASHPWHVSRSQSGRAAWTAVGSQARHFCEKSHEFSDLPHRNRAQVVHRIAKLADRFEAWDATAKNEGIGFLDSMGGGHARLTSREPAFWRLHSQLSDALGPITACHAMADLGMACVKPDIWVSRISVWFGWIDGLTPAQIMANRHNGWRSLFNNLEEIAHASADHAASPNPLRELDFFVANYGMMRTPKTPLDLNRL